MRSSHPFRRLASFAAAVAWIAPLAALAADAPAPPVAKKNAHESVLHGETRLDPYYWLREKENPEVVAYLEAENRYTEAVMQPNAKLEETLYREILGRIKQTDLSVPVLDGGFYYYNRTEEGKQYPIFCRKKGSREAPEEVILDGNVLALGQKFLGFGGQAVSQDGNLLAYATDVTGFRELTLYVKDLRTGQLLPDRREKVAGFAWADDNQTLFYGVQDAAKRPYRIYRHRLGEAEDTLVYEEKDERFRVGVRRSRSDAYLFLFVGSLTSTEVRYLPAGEPAGEWKVIAPRRENVEYGVDHRGGSFYIWANDTGRNFRLVEAPVADPSPGNWKELLPHRPDVMLEGASLFKGHMVLFEREAGLQHIAVKSFKTGETHRIAFPEPVYSVFGQQNPEFDTRLLRFVYQSFVTPPSVYDYDVETRERTLLKQTEVLGGYDAARYASERIFVAAADGAKIPVSIMYRKEVARDGRAPLHLTGYGAYGAAIPVVFNPNVLSLLDRGVVHAVAHIRGGGEMGKAWHDDGRMLHKMNTFTDFIAVAEALVAGKYAARDKVVIEGGSAGGLLMGAVTNLRPDLWKAVIAQVPFVDVINTMSDPSLPLTVGEFEEWGNPKNRAEYDYIKAYCPYTNVAAKPYPSILVTTSLNDSQVMYWEPAKWVAKLRSLKTDANPLLLKTNMAGGHGGSSGRYDRLREVAFAYAFLLWQVGLAEGPATPAAAGGS